MSYIARVGPLRMCKSTIILSKLWNNQIQDIKSCDVFENETFVT